MSRRSENAATKQGRAFRGIKSSKRGSGAAKFVENELASSSTHGTRKSPRNGRKQIANTGLNGHQAAPDSSGDDDGSGAQDDSGGESDDSGDGEDNDDGEPEEFAPSDLKPQKRGHQTGLSLTLSNTLLESLNSKKRAIDDDIGGDECLSRPTKQLKQEKPEHSSVVSSDDDDDDGYDAVNDISESEEDEPEMEKLEEKNIIASEEEFGVLPRCRARSVDSWEGFTLDSDRDDAEESFFFDDHFERTEPNSEIDAPSSEGLRDSNPAPRRRVRFVGIDSSTSSSNSTVTEFDNDLYFDLLMDCETPRGSRLPITSFYDKSEQPSDGGSDWEYQAVEEPSRFEVTGPVDRDRDSDHTASGYETDNDPGDTTDEEVLPPATVNRPNSSLRWSPSEPRTRPAPMKKVVSRANGNAAITGKPPAVGQWTADPMKPICVVDAKKKRMVYIRPKYPRIPQSGIDHSSHDSSPRTGFISLNNRRLFHDADNYEEDGFQRSMDAASGADMLWSGLLQGDPGSEYLRVGDVVADPEDFCPWYRINANGEYEGDDDDDDAEDAFESDCLNYEDFIAFGDDSSDSNDAANDNEDGEATEKETTGEVSPTVPISPIVPLAPFGTDRLPTIVPKQTSQRSRSSSLLSNLLDNGTVSAFRRNQHRHQTFIRRPLPSSALLAIKGGRHLAAATPISPIRKRKVSLNMNRAMAPFTGVNYGKYRRESSGST